MHQVAIICTAVLGLLLFGLGFGVSMVRGRHKVIIGHPSDPRHMMYKIVRAHGNTAEYAPFLAILILYLGSRQPAEWIVWTMVVATVSRILFVAGLITCPSLDRPHPLRFLGALGTYVSGIALSIALIVSA